MALKLNIRPEIEGEMEQLLPLAQVRSKTEYINRAIEEYNHQLRRALEIAKLTDYFSAYREEGRAILHEFARLQLSTD